MPNQQSLEISLAARDAFRRIRGAAVSGRITPEEMQTHSENISNAFAKALLSLEKPELLKSEDKEAGINHIQNLNDYISDLLQDEPKLNLAGNPFNQESVAFLLTVLTREKMLAKYGHPESTIVTLLSTGALNLALLSYIHDLKIHYAAVNRERDVVVLPQIPENESVTVIDDVLGQQVRATAKELESRGHKVTKKNIVGMSV